MNAVGPFFPTMITIRYIEIEWWDFNNLFLCFLRKERINRNVRLHLGKIEEKEYYLESHFLSVANNIHVSIHIGHEARFITADDEVLDHFTKMSPRLPASSGVLIANKVQPLLVLLEPSVFWGYPDLAALCRH